MMKGKLFLLSIGAMFLAACDYIAPSEQLIEVDDIVVPPAPTVVMRKALLEDFTGQKCSNCPTAIEVIEELQKAYGDRLIAVGIHSGPLGFKGTATRVGLATDLGDTYFNRWNLDFQPVGLINRGSAINYPEWMGKVREVLNQEAGTSLELSAQLSADELVITAKATRLAADAYAGKLQLWVVEDSIVAQQVMPDGKPQLDFVHNHVFRTAVNGTWGEEVALAASEERTWNYTCPVDAAWNRQHLSIVAFLYNEAGVEQVEKASILFTIN